MNNECKTLQSCRSKSYEVVYIYSSVIFVQELIYTGYILDLKTINTTIIEKKPKIIVLGLALVS